MARLSGPSRHAEQNGKTRYTCARMNAPYAGMNALQIQLRCMYPHTTRGGMCHYVTVSTIATTLTHPSSTELGTHIVSTIDIIWNFKRPRVLHTCDCLGNDTRGVMQSSIVCVSRGGGGCFKSFMSCARPASRRLAFRSSPLQVVNSLCFPFYRLVHAQLTLMPVLRSALGCA